MIFFPFHLLDNQCNKCLYLQKKAIPLHSQTNLNRHSGGTKGKARALIYIMSERLGGVECKTN